MKTNISINTISILLLTILLNGCQSENRLAHQQFLKKDSKVLVCAAHILDNQNCSYDTMSARSIVDYINTNKYATASITDLLPPPNNEWRMNEAKILTISINQFVEYIKKNKLPENTYILYPEFLKMGQNSNVVAVHYCLLDNTGRIAMRGLINSHWGYYQKVKPITNEDCVKVLGLGFDDKMKE